MAKAPSHEHSPAATYDFDTELKYPDADGVAANAHTIAEFCRAYRTSEPVFTDSGTRAGHRGHIALADVHTSPQRTQPVGNECLPNSRRTLPQQVNFQKADDEPASHSNSHTRAPIRTGWPGNSRHLRWSELDLRYGPKADGHRAAIPDTRSECEEFRRRPELLRKLLDHGERRFTAPVLPLQQSHARNPHLFRQRARVHANVFPYSFDTRRHLLGTNWPAQQLNRHYFWNWYTLPSDSTRRIATDPTAERETIRPAINCLQASRFTLLPLGSGTESRLSMCVPSAAKPMGPPCTFAKGGPLFW